MTGLLNDQSCNLELLTLTVSTFQCNMLPLPRHFLEDPIARDIIKSHGKVQQWPNFKGLLFSLFPCFISYITDVILFYITSYYCNYHFYYDFSFFNKVYLLLLAVALLLGWNVYEFLESILAYFYTLQKFSQKSIPVQHNLYISIQTFLKVPGKGISNWELLQWPQLPLYLWE